MQIPPGSARASSRAAIHPIAEDVVFLNDHVAEIDPNPELDPLLRQGGRISLGHAPLHFRRATNSVNHARELGQEAVAGVLYDPAPVLRDLRIDQLPEMSLEPLVRPLLIRAH
jgi:hypothetical protein